MPAFDIKPKMVKTKTIKILIEGTPPAEAKVFVETCTVCGKEEGWVPSTLVRPNHDVAWSVNGGLPPKGWKDGRCDDCIARMSVMGG